MTTLKVMMGLALAAAASGQMVNNQEKQLSCDSQGYNDRVRTCEMREQTTASVGLLNIDAGKNGGASIKGWSGGDVLVRTPSRRGLTRTPRRRRSPVRCSLIPRADVCRRTARNRRIIQDGRSATRFL